MAQTIIDIISHSGSDTLTIVLLDEDGESHEVYANPHYDCYGNLIGFIVNGKESLVSDGSY